MIDIRWIFTYLTKNRELDPGTADRILQSILLAVRNRTVRNSKARSSTIRDSAERGKNEF